MFFKSLSEMLLMWPTYFLSQSGGTNWYTPVHHLQDIYWHCLLFFFIIRLFSRELLGVRLFLG